MGHGRAAANISPSIIFHWKLPVTLHTFSVTSLELLQQYDTNLIRRDLGFEVQLLEKILLQKKIHWLYRLTVSDNWCKTPHNIICYDQIPQQPSSALDFFFFLERYT